MPISLSGSLNLSGSLTTTGTITAQTLVVQTITSSISSITGSTNFGSLSSNTHTFTGSMNVSGSGTFSDSVTANAIGSLFNANNGTLSADILTIKGGGGTGAFGFRVEANNGQAIFRTNNFTYNILMCENGGYVGIGTSSPSSRLYVRTTAGATKAYDDLSKTNIMCFDDTSMVEGVGGSITFGGYKTSTSAGGNFAAIDGIKENGTAGNEAGAFRIWTANSSGVFGERMRISSGGNVGIGTTTPAYKFETLGTSVITAAFGRSDYGASNVMLIAMNGYRDVYKQAIGVVRTGDYDKGDMIFCLNASANSTVVSSSDERMRITSAGYVGIDTDSTTAKLGIGRSANTESNIFLTRNTNTADVNIGCIRAALGPFWYDATSTSLAEINLQTDTTAYYKGAIMFSTNNSDATANRAALRMYINAAGSIGTTKNGTNIYNASDVRLKRNIETIEFSLDKILQLNPVKFNWVDGFAEDGKDMLGFIAQEVQNIIPEAVEDFGGEDNIVEIGDLKVTNPLRINEKFIIPVLVKAIQELTARVQYLENK
jgi:hypothetical protein